MSKNRLIIFMLTDKIMNLYQAFPETETKKFTELISIKVNDSKPLFCTKFTCTDDSCFHMSKKLSRKFSLELGLKYPR